MKDFMQEKGDDFVAEHYLRTLGRVYSNEGTGVTAAKRVYVKLEGVGKFQRRGRTTTECIGERCYLFGPVGDDGNPEEI